MISAKAATQKLFQKDFDEYGDSYVKDITPDRIQQIMDGIKVVSFLLYACCLYSFHTFLGFMLKETGSLWWGSSQRLTAYESDALPTAPHRLSVNQFSTKTLIDYGHKIYLVQ